MTDAPLCLPAGCAAYLKSLGDSFAPLGEHTLGHFQKFTHLLSQDLSRLVTLESKEEVR
jgi:hypothetical protein